jgi:hypothetical protein
MPLTHVFSNVANTASSSAYAPEGDTVFAVTGNFTGYVRVEMSTDAGLTWVQVPDAMLLSKGCFVLSTPDTSVLYRATASRIVGGATIYFGP